MRDWIAEGWTTVSDANGNIQGIFDEAADRGVDFLDPERQVVYIADVSEEPFEFYGFMLANYDENEIDGEDPVEWALGNVPAPGAWGAAEHMEQVETDDMIDIVTDNADDMYYRIWD